MQLCSVVILSCVLVLQANGQQRVPPGVNPGQYQQNSPPPPQQQQQIQGGQQQQQFQQPPSQQFQGQPHPQQQQFQGQSPPQQQQFQEQPPPQQQQFQGQVPQQQFQGQPPLQQQQFTQPPTQQQQFQGHPPQQQQPPQQQPHQVLHKDVTKEKEHMAEHMDVPIDTSNMSVQELQFHYFKMHDADGNNKIDGCELVKSLIHWHDHSNHDIHDFVVEGDQQPLPEEKIYKDDELVNMIDPILATDDKNLDGFIDYPEYILAKQAATARSQYALYQKNL